MSLLIGSPSNNYSSSSDANPPSTALPRRSPRFSPKTSLNNSPPSTSITSNTDKLAKQNLEQNPIAQQFWSPEDLHSPISKLLEDESATVTAFAGPPRILPQTSSCEPSVVAAIVAFVAVAVFIMLTNKAS